MSQSQVGCLRLRMLMFTDAEHQRQTRFFSPHRPQRVKDIRDDVSSPNSYCTRPSIEKSHETGCIRYPSLSFTAKEDTRGFPATPFDTSKVKVTTPSNIGRRRQHVASLIASPPRASHSVKLSKIFQDAHADLINASRKGLDLQNSPSPKLSTSKHRRTFGAQHQPPTLRRGDAVTKTPESWKLPNDQPPKFSTTPRPFAEPNSSQTNSRKSPPAMEQWKSYLEHKVKPAPIDTSIPLSQTPPIYDTVMKGNPEGGSPQLPVIQSLGDLFSDVAALLGPSRPETPPYDVSTKRPMASSASRPSLPRETILYSPTGTWSDDHIFYPGPSKALQVPQSPFSQAWTDDSKFYTGPLPAAGLPQPEPVTTNFNEEIVLTWLEKINTSAGDMPLSPKSMPRCDIDHPATEESINVIDRVGSSAKDASLSEESPPSSRSEYGTAPPKLGRSNSTCSSPPRVDSGSQSPPLSPLSPDVVIERGKRKRERSRTVCYYDEDILKAQEELEKKEDRRKARLQKYGC